MAVNDFKIIIADDDELHTFFNRQILNELSSDLEIISVHNGRQLMEELYGLVTVFEKFRGIIIIDLDMPVVDGFEAISQMKNNILLSYIPVYAFTTDGRFTIKEKCLRLGAKKCYTKPNNIFEWRDILTEILENEGILPDKVT